MNHGGVQVALINTLRTIDLSQYEVVIGVEDDKGELIHQIPKDIPIVNLLKYSRNETNSIKKLAKIIECRECALLAKLIVASVYNRLFHSENQYMKIYSRIILSEHNEHYNYIISYGAPNALSVYYSHYLCADNRILWIHGDVEKMKLDRKIDKEYKKFDQIICVSAYAKKSFCRKYPSLSYKTSVRYTPIDRNLIYKKAEEYQVDKQSEKCIILTVARLSDEKGINLAIDAARELKQEGFKFEWFICGSGPKEESYRWIINNENLTRNFHLLGYLENPYPYYKVADIYVQPSLNEGYCLSMAEAKCFNIPIVSTDFPVAAEHIKDDGDGIITKMDGKSIAEAILAIDKRENLKE